jgi:hypothetical protein
MLKKVFFAVLLAVVTAFSMLSCKKAVDPCTVAGTCANNAIGCIDGNCQCGEGYEGTGCFTEKTPKSITVTKVTIVDYPPLNNGQVWDFLSNPDWQLFFRASGPVGQTTVYNDCPLSVTPSWAVNIKLDPLVKNVILLYENDAPLADVLAASIVFTPGIFIKGSDFPPVITLTDTNITVKLAVTYQF